ncbi:hypothetical protein LY78DRAFT_404353 [Colletotrichum sublineola]|nr:hypothetical protein LY78DRAFT_404353 [Colletotrichum sublineola]
MWQQGVLYSLLRPLLIPCLLNIPIISATKCKPFRDQNTCKAETWQEEYLCLTLQNTSSELVDSVRTDFNGTDSKLCQDTHDKMPSRYDSEYLGEFPPSWAQCTSARQVLLAGSDYDDCNMCAMRGLIQACPEDDPNFWNCLCEWNTQPEHINCLSWCFASGSLEGLVCPQWTPEYTRPDPRQTNEDEFWLVCTPSRAAPKRDD